MVRHLSASVLLTAALGLSACNWGKVEELENERHALREENAKLVDRMAERERRIVESFDELNEIYGEIAAVDGQLVALKPQEGTEEGTFAAVTEATKQHIENIRAALEERKQRIAELTKRNEKLGIKISSLNKRIKTLSEALEAKQAEVIALQVQIGVLNETVAAQGVTIETQVQAIAAREVTIKTHETKLSELKEEMERVWYVVGTFDDLAQRLVVREEGGFLFGWGAVPVLQHPIDDGLYITASINTSEIGIPGPVEALVPARGPATYKLEETAGATRIVVLDPAAFWKEKHLAVILKD